jgi:GNAT superfamily N-acetyltransferase
MQLIQKITSDDLPFMRDMLYEAATIGFVLRAAERPAIGDVLSQPSNRRYLDAWGRDGDAGVIATSDDGGPLGAAWYRLFGEHERGDGIVAWPDTPEVAIGVAEQARGRGIGGALLIALIAHARDAGYARLVLSVDPLNPAHRLYERCGFRDVPAGDPHTGTSILMAVDL